MQEAGAGRNHGSRRQFSKKTQMRERGRRGLEVWLAREPLLPGPVVS